MLKETDAQQYDGITPLSGTLASLPNYATSCLSMAGKSLPSAPQDSLPYGSRPIMPLSPRGKVYRVRGIPLEFTKEKMQDILGIILDMEKDFIRCHSLALSPNYHEKTKVATVSFRDVLPDLLNEGIEWHFDLPSSDYSTDKEIVLDTHFNGFTPLQSSDDDDFAIDYIAISGLNGHAFGSFKERGGSYMWLRDSLAKHLPQARVLIYGFDSRLAGSRSFQDIEALASRFRNHVRAVRRHAKAGVTPRPLIFIAHSLGGLIVKEVNF